MKTRLFSAAASFFVLAAAFFVRYADKSTDCIPAASSGNTPQTASVTLNDLARELHEKCRPGNQ